MFVLYFKTSFLCHCTVFTNVPYSYSTAQLTEAPYTTPNSYLLPDRTLESKRKTIVVRRSCNPHWNQAFVYENVSWEDLQARCLELTVWDHDRITSNDFLGGVRLCLGTGLCSLKQIHKTFLGHLIQLYIIFIGRLIGY